MALQVVRAKPNPLGKDKVYGFAPPPDQLVAEWVDIANTGITAERLDGTVLYHKKFNEFCQDLGWERLVALKGVLQSGEVLRIHSGNPLSTFLMRAEETNGADYHLFTGANYVWNNSCGDSPGLFDTSRRAWVDIAYYGKYPPEGRILSRVGDRLV